MKILAIETATDACSAALLIGSDADNSDSHENNYEVAVEFELAPRKHTQLILPQIERLMASAQLSLQDMDGIAFGQGPGAFTGLRIAAGVTQGLALAADVPVIPVSTLAAMAQQSYQQYQTEYCLVALDARINEVYWGEYKLSNGLACLQGKEQVTLPQNIDQLHLSSHKIQWTGIGSGWDAYDEELRAIITKMSQGQLVGVYPQLNPSAEFIAQLAAHEYQQGNLLSVEQAQPIYLRDKVADTIVEREAKKKNAN